ncbi:hypothetical protein Aduo_019010 [Ancylostoma duodenale]
MQRQQNPPICLCLYDDSVFVWKNYSEEQGSRNNPHRCDHPGRCLQGCTKEIISGRVPEDKDYPHDMNHSILEELLQEYIPRMQHVAPGRPLALLMGNISSHLRQLRR